MNAGNVAIIGAGMAGLSAARVLADAGAKVSLFDKGRQPGGRLATRHAQGFTFNHGCQFFTARDPAFRAAIAPFSAAWDEAGPDRLAGVPDMATMAACLSNGLEPLQHAHVRVIFRQADGWHLRFDGADEGPFGRLILAIPAPQAAALLVGVHERFAAALAGVHLAPCWAVLLGFEAGFDGPPTGKREGGVISWLARETSRPGSSPANGYTLHAAPGWSQAHLEDDLESVIAALSDAAGLRGEPIYAAAHRWRYALADTPLGAPFLWDEEGQLGLCGDWCLGGRLEAAYISGRALGIRLAA
jgi:predicted NAD/FAD-dependent oxidoreductase